MDNVNKDRKKLKADKATLKKDLKNLKIDFLWRDYTDEGLAKPLAGWMLSPDRFGARVATPGSLRSNDFESKRLEERD